ncbi:microfibril-associated glycoprotein 4-like [Drosophila willistoni]|uniref:microfibril-associated glycoprotein 4-like n=1 Tax=Drosophila willistoni TaxID=7260 RepID=UPI000C26CAEB|nr:microfibril-associated glycoprotein 4-like [Drosophila willistoni]
MTVHLGMKFSTFDRDNDLWVDGNCAAKYSGAWWHKYCVHFNAFGLYLGGDYSDELYGSGMFWKHFGGFTNSLKSIIMMIRPTA